MQYLWGRYDSGTKTTRITAARDQNGYTDIVIPLNERKTFIVAQYADTISVELKNSGIRWTQNGLRPYEVANTKYMLGYYTGSSNTDYMRGSYRIYDLAMYEEGTDKCLFHFVPVRKRSNGKWIYGLYDTVNHKELTLVAGEVLP